MSDLPKFVHIAEEGPREGFQIEKGPIPTEGKVRLIDALSETGLKHIQICSFVNPKRVPGMADAEAVARGIKINPEVEYTALWFNERGLEQAMAVGHLTVDCKITLYASEHFLISNLNRDRAQHLDKLRDLVKFCIDKKVPINRAGINAAFGCNFEGDVSVESLIATVDDTMALANEFNLDIEAFSLADSMAWATPDSIKRGVGAVKDKYPDMPIRLHLHNTRGMGIANAYAGLEMGVDRFDSSIAGLGGCPFAKHQGAAGNVATEDLAFMCGEMGIETGLDLDALIESSQIATEVVAHDTPACIAKGGSLNAIRQRLKQAAE
ncbi:MAG: hydroxymethylglutaryl-CoA lyase [Rhodospirillaceae bacterium]|nr:hydroxymethylglutaryl-CoA lyase [Rhodospirillaceae bacterium]